MNTAVRAALFGAPIGTLGGLIGLGGAEFRLPVLKAAFDRPTPRAVALNLAISMLTLISSLVVRVRVAPPRGLVEWMPVLVSISGGAMAGAYLGASYASRISVERLEQWIMLLLVGIGLVLIGEAFFPLRSVGIDPRAVVRVPVAAILGVGVGLVSSLLGVAGGEVIIPILALVFGADIKTAGTLSVLISLPTVAVGIWRYARRGGYDRSDLRAIAVPMGGGSIVGALAGGYLVPYVRAGALKLALGIILIVSAVRIFRHARRVS